MYTQFVLCYRFMLETIYLFMFRLTRRPMPFHIYKVYQHDSSFTNKKNITEDFFMNKLVNVDSSDLMEYRITDNKFNKYTVIEKVGDGLLQNFHCAKTFIERPIHAKLNNLDITEHFMKYIGPNANFFNTEVTPNMILGEYSPIPGDKLDILTNHGNMINIYYDDFDKKIQLTST